MTSTVVLSGGKAMPSKPTPAGVAALKGPNRGRPARPAQPASREAQRLAATILEVLAGVRTPPDAAAALSVSLPRYYLWEQRALAGLVAACEPRPVGKGASSQQRIASLEKELARLRQDCARQQALVRAAQRTIGLGPPPPAKPAVKASSKAPANHVAKAKRKRRRFVANWSRTCRGLPSRVPAPRCRKQTTSTKRGLAPNPPMPVAERRVAVRCLSPFCLRP